MSRDLEFTSNRDCHFESRSRLESERFIVVGRRRRFLLIKLHVHAAQLAYETLRSGAQPLLCFGIIVQE